MKKILASLSIIASVGIVAFGISSAFFSDTETSTNNVLQAGKLDLKIDNESYYNGVFNEGTSWSINDLTNQLFFDFLDIKPSDWGEDTISLHVDDNNAWACMQVNMTANDDNTCTEPELLDDETCTEPGVGQGELAQNLNFLFWVDDGDNVLEEEEQVFREGTANTLFNGDIWPLQDSATNLFEVTGPLLGTKTYYIGKAWCFGTLSENRDSQDGVGNVKSPETVPGGGVSCDGQLLDNATQSDIVKGDIEFSAYQARNNDNFLCIPQASPSPSPSPSAPPLACVEGYAVTAHENNQGTRKDTGAILANRTIPSAMFGAPQTTGTPTDVGFPAGSFFSLGFKPPYTGFGPGGSIVLGFSQPFFDNPGGDDLQVYEVTGGVYPDEIVKVEIGPTSTGPWTEVAAGATRDASVEFPGTGLSGQFVKLTDVSQVSLFPNDADAYDVDAVKVTCIEEQQ